MAKHHKIKHLHTENERYMYDQIITVSLSYFTFIMTTNAVEQLENSTVQEITWHVRDLNVQWSTKCKAQ